MGSRLRKVKVGNKGKRGDQKEDGKVVSMTTGGFKRNGSSKLVVSKKRIQTRPEHFHP